MVLNKVFNFTKDSENKGSMSLKGNEKKAELYFYGDIVSDNWKNYGWAYDDDKCPKDIIDFFADLEDTAELDVYINSGGGMVYAGLAIHNIIKRHSGKVTVHVDSLAASIASIIALSGNELVIPVSAQFMIHKPTVGAWGNADDLRKEADYLDTCQETLLDIYMEHVKPGVTAETINEMINAETWFTGKKAAEYFNVTVNTSSTPMNCAKSSYFKDYANTPTEVINSADSIDKVKARLQFELELYSQ